jgi:hypothetical protein
MSPPVLMKAERVYLEIYNYSNLDILVVLLLVLKDLDVSK